MRIPSLLTLTVVLDTSNIIVSDDFAGVAKDTIDFWTTERRDGGEPNSITLETTGDPPRACVFSRYVGTRAFPSSVERRLV